MVQKWPTNQQLLQIFSQRELSWSTCTVSTCIMCLYFKLDFKVVWIVMQVLLPNHCLWLSIQNAGNFWLYYRMTVYITAKDAVSVSITIGMYKWISTVTWFAHELIAILYPYYTGQIDCIITMASWFPFVVIWAIIQSECCHFQAINQKLPEIWWGRILVQSY